MHIKLAVVSGRPDDSTILTSKEKQVWNELCRVLKDDLSQMVFQKFHFHIPIYSKFDLEVLRCIESLGYPATLYVPNDTWGLSKLPKHQVDMIKRLDLPRVIVSTNRINKMIEDSDMVYLLDNTKGVETFKKSIGNKFVVKFPVKKMRYTTEEECLAYNNRMMMRA